MLSVEQSTLNTASNVQFATGASAVAVAANSERNGLNIQAPSTNSAPVYLRLDTGTASATAAHIQLVAGSSWNGLISGVLWTGPVTSFSTAAQVLLISEV